jgi:hypothetical protein
MSIQLSTSKTFEYNNFGNLILTYLNNRNIMPLLLLENNHKSIQQLFLTMVIPGKVYKVKCSKDVDLCSFDLRFQSILLLSMLSNG